MVNSISPIFILGVPRSGTTLLSFILDSHPHIAAGRETLILQGIKQILGDADGNDDTTLLFRNWYQRYGLEREQFLDYVRKFLNEFFGDYARKCEKKRWAEKTPLHIYHAELIHEIYPRAKLIHMIRDPRAVCASRKVWKGTIVEFAKEWADQNIRLSDFGAQLGPNLYKKIRYEDLALNPRSVLTDLMNYLEEPMFESLLHHETVSSLRYIAAGSDKSIDPLHARVYQEKFVVEGGPKNDPRRTIDTESLGLWMTALKQSEMSTIEEITRKGMIRFGYSNVTRADRSGKTGSEAGLAWREYPDNIAEATSTLTSGNNPPDISIIMPTWNRANFLDRAIQDVQKQTFQSWELIIINDGSTDETKNIIEKHLQDPRIHYVEHPHRGLSASRNAGLCLARGKYLAFHDDDDLWLPERLKIGYDWLQTHPQHAFVYSPVFIQSRNKRTIYPESIKRSDLVTLVDSCEIQVCSITLRNDLIQHIGFFNEKIEMCEDYDLWLRIASEYEFGCIPTILAEYHIHSGNMTQSNYQLYDGMRNVLSKLRETELASIPNSLFNRRMAGLHFFLFHAARKELRFWIGWNHFLKFVFHFLVLKWRKISDKTTAFESTADSRVVPEAFSKQNY
jgi:glycosyltransferase involved in cell wall biosynthesis